MINREELLDFSREFQLEANVVEKDYALGWLLAGITNHPALRDTWVFKGGTCLKKCFFETYRFSEDLDFTLRDPAHLDVGFLTDTFAEIADWVYDTSGLELPRETFKFEVYANPRGVFSAQGRVGYRGPLGRTGDPPRIKLDLANDEILVLEPVRRPVHHPYSDCPGDGIDVLCYAFEEVFAEKVRALTERLRPRDLYDVVHLYRRADLQPDRALVRSTLARKCEFKGIPVPTAHSIQNHPVVAELQAEWKNMLGHQLPALPPFDQFWAELPTAFAWLEEAPIQAGPAVMGRGRYEIDETWRAPAMAGYWHAEGISAPLEIIHFAAANRLCVELDYQDEDGRRSARTIEPYSLRRTKVGELLLYAVRSQDGQDRSYRVDRILGARATQQTFMPRYAVELSATAPLHAPDVSRARASVAPFNFGLQSKPKRTPKRSTQKAVGFGQAKYVFQCMTCKKKFERTSYDAALNAHKTKDGYPCPGRVGFYVTMKQ